MLVGLLDINYEGNNVSIAFDGHNTVFDLSRYPSLARERAIADLAKGTGLIVFIGRLFILEKCFSLDRDTINIKYGNLDITIDGNGCSYTKFMYLVPFACKYGRHVLLGKYIDHIDLYMFVREFEQFLIDNS